MWISYYIFCLICVNAITGELLYPVLTDQPVEEVQMPKISQEDIKNAFQYSRQQANRRIEIENNYLKAGNDLSNSISPDGRLFSSITQASMEMHRIQEQFEDATKYLVHKYNLTRTQTEVGLPKLELPDNDPLVQQCKKLKIAKSCTENTKYRTLDGSCNNLNLPNQGKSNTCFSKLLKTAYADGISSPRTSVGPKGLPDPRVVSTIVEPGLNISSKTISHMFVEWGQIIAHDTAHTVPARAGENNSQFSCCSQNASGELPSSCLPIGIPETDSFYSRFNVNCMSFVRCAACSNNCTLGGVRHNVNQQSSYIDGSVVYGINETVLQSIRTLVKGGLRTQETTSGQLLPASDNPDADQCSRTTGNYTCFKSGDIRVNQQPGLTAMQTLLLRQHNRIAGILAESYPNETDEVLFQEVRRIIGAQMQMITFKEYLPLVIGPPLMKYFNLEILDSGYTEYDQNFNPTITNEFATKSFRFGHIMVQDYLNLIGKNDTDDGSLPLRKNQDCPISFYEGKLSSIVRGLYHQPAQAFNPRQSSSLANHLLETSDGAYGLDIQAIGLQREREQGLPPYPEFLKYCYNISITSFEELNITIPEKYWKMWSSLYGSVNDLDPYTALLEFPVIDGIVGPVTACVLGKQFQSLKFGDRFYVEHGNQIGSFTQDQLKELRKTTLARIICDNSDDVDTSTPDVFRTISPENQVTSCENIPVPDFANWMEK